MQLVQLVVENTFINSTASSVELGLTVYDRVFAKLINHGGTIGKVHPIYLVCENDSKTLGILTKNKGGSYSFFPELPGNYDFDHITFSKDLTKDNHHYTRVSMSGREKILPISAEHLSNGTYHATTFYFKDFQLLKGIPKEVIYPTLEINKLKDIEEAFITSGNPEGSTLLKVDKCSGVFCMQMFLIPKDVDFKSMTLYPKPFKVMQPDFELEDNTLLYGAVIPHEYQDDYVFGIMAFFYDKEVDSDLLIVTTAKTNGFYSKLEIVKK